MTTKQIIERESIVMGQQCKPVKSLRMPYKIVCVLYSYVRDDPGFGSSETTRLAVYQDDTALMSAIINTNKRSKK